MSLKLGVIGLSDGNGHPYSWAAICNGYSPEHMKDCEFPVIPQYLGEQIWPDARLPDVEVTHIWTQDIELSAKVAKTSLISSVVKSPEEMLGQVDAILLARDDAENHLAFATPIIKAGIPIYIDKPIAHSVAAMEKLYALQAYDGQIFTCSALRYANELTLSEEDLMQLGTVKHIHATTPKSWQKYAVHIIEPSLQIIRSPMDHDRTQTTILSDTARSVSIGFENGITANFSAFGSNIATPLAIRVHGTEGWKDLVFNDSFTAFRTALSEFVEGIRTSTCRSPIEFNRAVVSIIETGLKP